MSCRNLPSCSKTFHTMQVRKKSSQPAIGSKSLVIHLLIGINELIRIVNSPGLLATPKRSYFLGRPGQDSGDLTFVSIGMPQGRR